MRSSSLPTIEVFQGVARRLSRAGFARTATQCRAKFKNLKAAFYEALEEHGPTPPRAARPPFHPELLDMWDRAGRPPWQERRPCRKYNIPCPRAVPGGGPRAPVPWPPPPQPCTAHGHGSGVSAVRALCLPHSECLCLHGSALCMCVVRPSCGPPLTAPPLGPAPVAVASQAAKCRRPVCGCHKVPTHPPAVQPAASVVRAKDTGKGHRAHHCMGEQGGPPHTAGHMSVATRTVPCSPLLLARAAPPMPSAYLMCPPGVRVECPGAGEDAAGDTSSSEDVLVIDEGPEAGPAGRSQPPEAAAAAAAASGTPATHAGMPTLPSH